MTPNIQEELKPCPLPWCNGSGAVDQFGFGEGKMIVECEDCGLITPLFDTSEEAITAWNSRPTEEALKARVEELEGALEVVEGKCAAADHNAWKAGESIHSCVGEVAQIARTALKGEDNET